MDDTDFVGRKAELRKLELCYRQGFPKAVAVYGRRRVGKTRLVREFCKNKPHIDIDLSGRTADVVLDRAAWIIADYLEADAASVRERISCFQDLFIVLRGIESEERIVIFLDELPDAIETFDDAAYILKHYIDYDLEEQNALLVVSGSSVSGMLKELDDDEGPLFHRFPLQMRVKPLPYREARGFHPGLPEEDRIRIYAIAGGIPYYHRLFGDMDPEAAIKDLFLSEIPPLRLEASSLLSREFPQWRNYERVMSALSNGTGTLKEVTEKTGLNKNTCSDILRRLEIADIVVRRIPYGKSNKSATFAVSDGLSAFTYGVVDRAADPENASADANYAMLKSAIDTFYGFRFEIVCMQYLAETRTCRQIGNWTGKVPRMEPDGTPVLNMDGSMAIESTDLDIVAKVEENGTIITLAGECRFTKWRSGRSEFENLRHVSDHVLKGVDNVRYIIFSRSGFTEELERMSEDGDLELVSVEDMGRVFDGGRRRRDTLPPQAGGRPTPNFILNHPFTRPITMKGTKALVTMLERKGVDTIFGYPGGSVIPIYDELYDSSLRHILVRHEQCAAHMADGYARASGRPGVCIATSGPGATNLVTGVATAYADSVPMIALTGQVGVGSLGLGAFQEVDAYSLLMPITKHNFRVLDVNRLPHAIKEAWEICQTGRPGPVHVDLPVDQMNASIDPSVLDEEYGVKPLSEDLSGLDEAVRWIRDAKRPVILCGGGAVNASDEVMALSRRLGAPVDMTLMGMGVVPSSYELCMGPLGMHGRMAALQMMNDADLVISVGSRFADRTYGRRCRMQDPNGRVVHIDVDATEFGKHGHPSVDLQCDCARAIRMILERLGTVSAAQDWTAKAKESKRRCRCDPCLGDTPIKPQDVMHELNGILDADTIITTDVGQNQMWAMHYLDIEHPRQLLSSGTFGTMGYGLPAAIGAKAARPDKHVIAVTGDGGFQMVMQEMATSMAEDLPVTVVLLNNGTLGMVRQWQKLFWNERYSATTLKCDPDFVKMAEAFGAEGIRVERPGEIRDALVHARDCGRSCIIDITCDPDEHALPMVPADPNAAMVMGRCRYSN